MLVPYGVANTNKVLPENYVRTIVADGGIYEVPSGHFGIITAIYSTSSGDLALNGNIILDTSGTYTAGGGGFNPTYIKAGDVVQGNNTLSSAIIEEYTL